MPRIEPELLRPQPDVLPLSYTHPSIMTYGGPGFESGILHKVMWSWSRSYWPEPHFCIGSDNWEE